MKILVAHNSYQQRGGEDAVVDSEVALLRAHGHEVTEYRRHNDEINEMAGLQVAADMLWSRRTSSDLANLLRVQRPDVIHAHNTFPLISPSLAWAASAARVPLVQTLHNFRLMCPEAMLLRDGQVCESCVGRTPWPAVRHGCYRGSRVQTAVLSSMLVLHRAFGTYDHKVALYIALNGFCRDKFVAGGLPAERLVIKPNFVEDPGLFALPRSGLLFVGRLSQEKGIDALSQAASVLPARSLRVVGTGPRAPQLDGNPGLVAVGALKPADVTREMAGALALVLPSIWYENFPRTLVEAFACGLPVLASRIGALAELVQEGETGLLVNPDDPVDLAKKMQWALEHPEKMAHMGRAARRVYEQEYTPASNHSQLLEIYARAKASC